MVINEIYYDDNDNKNKNGNENEKKKLLDKILMWMRMRMRMRMTIKNKNIFFINLTNQYIKMSYYWFNREEVLQKAKERYSKEKAAEYYLKNKEAIKEKGRDCYKNLSQEEKDKIIKYQKKKKK